MLDRFLQCAPQHNSSCNWMLFFTIASGMLFSPVSQRQLTTKKNKGLVLDSTNNSSWLKIFDFALVQNTQNWIWRASLEVYCSSPVTICIYIHYSPVCRTHFSVMLLDFTQCGGGGREFWERSNGFRWRVTVVSRGHDLQYVWPEPMLLMFTMSWLALGVTRSWLGLCMWLVYDLGHDCVTIWIARDLGQDLRYGYPYYLGQMCNYTILDYFTGTMNSGPSLSSSNSQTGR